MTTATWAIEELSRIGGAEELQLGSARTDGSLRPYVTMWVVASPRDRVLILNELVDNRPANVYSQLDG